MKLYPLQLQTSLASIITWNKGSKNATSTLMKYLLPNLCRPNLRPHHLYNHHKMAFKLFPITKQKTSFLKLSTAVDKYVRKLCYFPVIKQTLINFGLNTTQDVAQAHHPIETFQLKQTIPCGNPRYECG